MRARSEADPMPERHLVAAVAEYALLVPALAVLAVVLARRKWRIDLASAVLAAIGAAVFVKIAAALRFEQRPFVVLHTAPLIPHAADNAFPSDHLAACGLAVAYLWPRSRPLAVLALLIAGAIGAARVLALVHWPVDIVAGFLLGAAGATLGLILTRALFRSRRNTAA